LVVDATSASDLSVLRLQVNGAQGLGTPGSGGVVATTAIGAIEIPVLRRDHLLPARVSGTEIRFGDGPGPALASESSSGGDGSGADDLRFGTFLGGTANDLGTTVARGADGSTYVAGSTFSTDFPTTPGAFDPAANGDWDAFVSKLDPTGSKLDHSTFIGGTNYDVGNSVSVDAAGAVYIGGFTASDNFPTTPGAFSPTYNGTSDAFVTKLDPQGASLVYSTYMGGSDSNNNWIFGLALASDGMVYGTGYTSSADFPTTPGAFDRVINDDGVGDWEDAFVIRLSADGSALDYGTFLGGQYGEYGYGVAVAPDGTAYATGRTRSDDFPVTPGAFDPTYNGGDGDVFVSRLSADGSALVSSTYLGGRDYEEPESMGVDTGGNAYVVGDTGSVDFPTTPGAYDRTANSGIIFDAFVTKVDPTGGHLVYSTYLGGKSFDTGKDLELEADGTVTVTGETDSSNFPTTPGAFDRMIAPPGDTFVSRFDPSGSYLAYSTFLGGTGILTDEADAIAWAGPGLVSVAGETGAADFPVTAGAYDTTVNGEYDAFAVTLQVADTMHVASIVPRYKPMGPAYVVGANVQVVNQDGSPVVGATIKVGLTYPDGSKVTLTGRTGRLGSAIVSRTVSDSGTYTFTVLSVAKPPAVYDSSQNVETSDSITIP